MTTNSTAPAAAAANSAESKASAPKVDAAANSATLPFLYKSPVVLQVNDHAEKALAPHADFRFAQKSNVIPLTVAEFMPAIRNYPIVFGNAAKPFPVVLVGLKQDDNLHLEEDGSWKAGAYLPAYLRRYPFILSETDDKNTVMLAVDAGSERFVDAASSDKAVRFFEKDKTPSEFSKQMLDFSRAYHAEYLQTELFVKQLQDADLLVQQQADMRFADNSQYKLDGFLVVDPERLKKLSAEKIKELNDNGVLAAIALHLASLQNWQLLLDMQSEANSRKKS